MFGGFVDGIKGSLDKLQESINANKLKALAESLLMISIAIVALAVAAETTPGGLDKAMDTLGVLITIVTGFAILGGLIIGILDNKTFEPLKSSAAFTSMITGISIMLLSMTAVVAILGSINETDLTHGVIALGAISLILDALFITIGIIDVNMAKNKSNIVPQMTQLTKGVTSLAIGIVAIVGAIAAVGALSNIPTFEDGIIVTGAVVGGLLVVLGLIGKSTIYHPK